MFYSFFLSLQMINNPKLSILLRLAIIRNLIPNFKILISILHPNIMCFIFLHFNELIKCIKISGNSLNQNFLTYILFKII